MMMLLSLRDALQYKVFEAEIERDFPIDHP